MKKSIIIGILIALLSLSSVFAEVNVFVNGDQIEFKDAKPVVRNGRTTVPISIIAKSLGINYAWNNETQTVIFNQSGDKELELKIGEKNSFIENGRTYVPLKFIAENFGQEVTWREESKTVVIGENAKEIEIEPTEIQKPIEIEDVKKAYNELSDFRAIPLNEVDILKNFNFILDNKDEWGEAENIKNVYYLTEEDLPIRLGNVVITNLTKDKSPYNKDIIMVSGYVLSGSMGTGTVATGFIDTQGLHRHRTFLGLNNEYYNYFIKKYPNIKGLSDGGKNLVTTYSGEEFTYILPLTTAGGEPNFDNFKLREVDKIIMYSYKYGKDVILFDNFIK